MAQCTYTFSPPAAGLYQSGTELPGCLVSNIEINNKTMIPGLEDRLRYILSEELLRRGCKINKDGFSIYGSIRDFNMSTVAERSNQIALYEIIITTSFKIITPDGKELSRSFSSPFITDFKSGSRLEDIIIARDREIDKIMRDITVEIIYGISTMEMKGDR